MTAPVNYALTPALRELLWAVADDYPDDTAARLRLLAHYLTHGQPERAEFIRLQIEEDRFGGRTPAEIRRRSQALLKAHEGRWRMVGCSECHGQRRNARGGTCLTCDGLGDSGGLCTVSGNTPFHSANVTWRGGTPHAVAAKLFEVVGSDGSASRWAFRVAGFHPTVREFRASDRWAVESESKGRPVYGFRAGDREACDADAGRVPQTVIDTMAALDTHILARTRAKGKGLSGLYYGTSLAAETALWRGLGVIVRRAVNAARNPGQKKS